MLLTACASLCLLVSLGSPVIWCNEFVSHMGSRQHLNFRMAPVCQQLVRVKNKPGGCSLLGGPPPASELHFSWAEPASELRCCVFSPASLAELAPTMLLLELSLGASYSIVWRGLRWAHRRKWSGLVSSIRLAHKCLEAEHSLQGFGKKT